MFVSPAKMAKPVEVQSRGWLAWAQGTMYYMGSRSPIERGNFWGLSGPLKSIVSHCCSVRRKKSESEQLMQATAQQPNGWCHINFYPVKNPPSRNAAACQNYFTTCYLPHQRWWEVMFLPASVHVYLWTTSWRQFKVRLSPDFVSDNLGLRGLNFGGSKVKVLPLPGYTRFVQTAACEPGDALNCGLDQAVSRMYATTSSALRWRRRRRKVTVSGGVRRFTKRPSS